MKKFLKFLLIVFLWLFVLGICIAGAILLAKPMQQGLQVLSVIFVLWYSLKLIIYMYKRWQAKKRVENLVKMEDAPPKEFNLSWLRIFEKTDFEQHINRVISVLKSSSDQSADSDFQKNKWNLHLKLDNQHNSWLQSSTVNKPRISAQEFSENNYLKWIPFNHCLLMDVDAYLINSDEPTAQSLWYEFLDGLAGCQKIIPIDGVTFSVHTKTLNDPDALISLSDTIQKCMQDIKVRCGFSVPLNFVLVGLDDIPCMADYYNNSTDALVEPLGSSLGLGQSCTPAVSQLFGFLNQVVQKSSLDNLYQQGLVSFDNTDATELNTIHTAFTELIDRLSVVNDFTQPPYFSGIYLVSGQNSHNLNNQLLQSHALCPYNAISTRSVTESDKKRYKRLATYYAVALTLTVSLFVLHDKGQTELESIFTDYQTQLSSVDDSDSIVRELESRAALIDALELVNLMHWLLGDDPLQKIPLAKRFTKDVREVLVQPIENAYNESISAHDDLDAKVDYLNVLMRRVNISNAVLSGDSIDAISQMPVPFDSLYITDVPPVLLDGLNRLLLSSYTLGRRFFRDEFEAQLMEERKQQKAQLTEILKVSGTDMQWLVDWTNTLGDIYDVQLSDYWPIESSDRHKVSRAYTVEGKAVIDAVIEQLYIALGNQDLFLQSHEATFRQQYQRNYLARWNAFLTHFNDGKAYMSQRDDWLFTINNLPTGRNIFFALLNDAWFQLQPFAEVDEIPDWHALLIYYQDMLALSGDELQNNDKRNKLLTKMALKLVKKAGPLGKAIAGAGKSGMKTQKKLDKASGPGPGPTEREINLETAAKELDAYKATIAEVVFNIERRNNAFAGINHIYLNPNGPETGETSLARGFESLKTLESLIGKAGQATMAFWEPLMGAIKLSRAFMEKEVACYLNDKWESEFLYDLEGVPDYKVIDFAYGENGDLWEFVDTHLSGFLNKRVKIGYQKKRIDGDSIAVESDFVQFLNQAMDASKDIQFESYPLDITAYPTSVNSNALLYVSQTKILFTCSDETFSIQNDNFIQTQRIDWNPNCSKVTLQFQVGNYMLDHHFSGRHAVRDFLHAFENGSYTLDVEAFPEDFYNLSQFQVRNITISLDINGAERLLHSLDKAPPRPPSIIAKCWA